MRTQKFGLFSPYQKFGAIQAMHNLPYFQQKLLQKPKRLFLESSRVGNQTTEHRKVRVIESLRPKPGNQGLVSNPETQSHVRL